MSETVEKNKGIGILVYENYRKAIHAFECNKI
jgi:hypothetical protein